MAMDCRDLRLSAWGARSGEDAPAAASDAEGPSMVGPRASCRPPLPIKPLDSVTRHKKPGVIASVEVHLLKAAMIEKERLIKDLEAENEKLRHQLVETLQTANESKSYVERKDKEVQLLVRSVEDLEVTIVTLEDKVLALQNENAMKEILAMPSTGKAMTCSRHHEYRHQNLLNAHESNEMPEIETFLFDVSDEMKIYEKESEKIQLEPAGLLDSILEEGRWSDLIEHVDHVFRVHSEESEVAVPCALGVCSSDLRFAHPELYCLPRRQLALELASEGKFAEARVLANDVHAVVVWTSQNSSRWYACHLMGLMLFKGQVLITSLTEEISRKDIDRERMHTCTAIRDYLCVYLPRSSGWLPTTQVANLDDPNHLFEIISPRKARCLLCHEFTNRKGHMKVCPAVTPCIKARFPQLCHKVNWHERQYQRYQEKNW